MTDDIGFKIFAIIDGLKSSMTEAATSVKTFSDEAKASVEHVGTAFEAMNSVMLKFAAVVAGGAFFKEAIDSTVQWASEVRGLSKQFAITTEEASGLAVALKSIGLSTEDYRGAAQKLDRQIKSNEEKIKELGMTTRDTTTGALLPQQQLMMNAIATMRSYQEGTDRNIAAQYLFGRGVGDTSKMLRLTSEEIHHGAEEAEKFGLVLDQQTSSQVIAYKRAMVEVHEAMEGVGITVGKALIPLLTSLSEVFTSNSVALRTVEIMVKAVATAFIGLQTTAFAITDAIGMYFAEMVVKFESYTRQIKAYATLNFTEASNAAREGQERLREVTNQGFEKLEADMATQRAKIAQIWNIGGVNDEKTPAAKKDPDGTKHLKETGQSEATKEAIALAQLEVATKNQLGKIGLQNKRDVLAAEVALGRITKNEEIAQLRDYAEQEYQIDLQALKAKEKIAGQTTLELKKTQAQELVLAAKHNQDLARLDLQAIQAKKAQYHELFATLNSGFKSMITGILQGTQTWQQGLQHMFSNILVSFAGFLEEKAAKWAEEQIYELIFGKATAAATSEGIITAHAAEAGAAAYASTAAIPIIGPALAPAAGIAAYAGALSYAAVASAAGGYDVPRGVNPVTQIHSEEMVLPAPLANAVRSMASDGGSSGGEAPIHLHFHTLDQRTGAQFLMANMGTIAKGLRTEGRNANPNVTGMRF